MSFIGKTLFYASVFIYNKCLWFIHHSLFVLNGALYLLEKLKDGGGTVDGRQSSNYLFISQVFIASIPFILRIEFHSFPSVF